MDDSIKMMNRYRHIFFQLLVLQVLVTAKGQIRDETGFSTGCDTGSCYPATGNLVIGREKNLTATSTCGTHTAERFCVVSLLQSPKKCFICDSRSGKEYDTEHYHGIQNIIYTNFEGTNKPSWWQSENGKEHVTIQLDLEAEFHFTHLVMKFVTFRPAAMLIERSSDFGKTWKVYRYFADDCERAFPNRADDTACDSKYSSVEPSAGGEVILRVLNRTYYPKTNDPYSKELQELMKMTNLRLNFTKLHTLGDDHLDKRPEIQEKYYYAISQIMVRGSCWCYGHAHRCLPVEGVEKTRPDMVHGRCDCTHHTTGLNCRYCEDTHNDLPWSPAFGKNTNACKKCNCNNHADKCKFSEEQYNRTGRVSGGVCIDCQHNTVGSNCEQCKPGYYLDPNKSITHPEACLPCQCDINGSLNNGLCDPKTDIANGLEAGRCHCKANVDGYACNVCKPGFWNFDPNNPDGCEECTCDKAGTVPGSTCDMTTGDCKCKPNVTGKNCNQCLPEHWGLVENSDGCQSCDCDLGGSRDTNCDVVSGDCKCWPNIVGRTCSNSKQIYFVPDLDMVFEAEYSHCSGPCKVALEVLPKDRPPSWTGPGYMRVMDNTELTFTIDGIKKSLDYDLVIRYEPQAIDAVTDVAVSLKRDRPVDSQGVCGNTQPLDDEKYISLRSSSWYAVTSPLCLEAGQKYKLTLSFRQSNNNQIEAPSASILIDSVVLLPKVETLDIFSNSVFGMDKRNEYMWNRCNETYLTPLRHHESDICKKLHFSVSAALHSGANDCNCDSTGSLSAVCEPVGGGCKCKPNVVGRTCDSCAPGTYGFGSLGCTDCDCNSIGALNKFCDPESGQCSCKAGTYGRACNLCKPGSWKYPECLPCECNGHAYTCDTKTGKCIDCIDFTTGDHCEMCKEGFYGDPRKGMDLPCRPCRCPDTKASGHSFASSCNLIENTKEVVCECEAGYAGPRCDICADNYFGNPIEPGETCRPCECNNNIDVSKPGNCDLHTGECLQCLFNTTGHNCELCKDHYYGNALNQDCKECGCSSLGTDISKGPCNPMTGQCPCLPNVRGLQCDSCEPNHWRLALGLGCEPCDCDQVGSESPQCNTYMGNCTCKPGFGGRQCNQCQENYWGDPKVQCYPCDCNIEGSRSLQCDQRNGTCFCNTGVGGDKCDQCARGYIGESPYCDSCGECFVKWDMTITKLAEQTDGIIQDAREINRTGATGAYNVEFEDMNRKLAEVNKTLSDTKNNTGALEILNSDIELFRNEYGDSLDKLNKLSSVALNVLTEISTANLSLISFNSIEKLNEAAKNLHYNATQIQEKDLKGALNLTREAGEKSREVKEIEQNTSKLLEEVDRDRKRVEKFFKDNETFEAKIQETDERRLKLDSQLTDLRKRMPEINKAVCGREGDPCDSLCGGGGCGSCGGLSCDAGAVSLADNGLQSANKSVAETDKLHQTYKALIMDIKQASNATSIAHTTVQNVYTESLNVKSQFETLVQQTSNVTNKLKQFLEQPGATSNEIRYYANLALNYSIHLKPEQIKNLSKKISEIISSMKDVKTILETTKDDRENAHKQKQNADKAKSDAEAARDKKNKVTDALVAAEEAQQQATKAITKANDDITNARRYLTKIASETSEAEMKAKETREKVENLKNKLDPLQTKVYQNYLKADNVFTEIENVAQEVVAANHRAKTLDEKYSAMNDALNQRSLNSTGLKGKAKSLLERAQRLLLDTKTKDNRLKEAEKEYHDQEEKLMELDESIKELTDKIKFYTDDINSKAHYYQSCNS